MTFIKEDILAENESFDILPITTEKFKAAKKRLVICYCVLYVHDTLYIFEMPIPVTVLLTQG